MSETGLLLLSASIYGTYRITPPLLTNHFEYSELSKVIDRQFQNKQDNVIDNFDINSINLFEVVRKRLMRHFLVLSDASVQRVFFWFAKTFLV